jgi:hypothetical protein
MVVMMVSVSTTSYAGVVLFSDTFISETGGEVHDLQSADCDAGRGGVYGSVGYTQSPEGAGWQHQVRPENELLLTGGGGKIGVNVNMNGSHGVGGFEVAVDIAPARNADVTNDNWLAVMLGAGGLNDVWGGGFGVLFRKNGTIQVFDNGTNIVSDTIVWNATPDSDYHAIRITANDAGDDNPFDGVGTTTFEVFVDGSSIYSVSLAGSGYANNYVNLQGNWENNMFDNLVITGIPEPATMLLLGLGALVLRRRK